MAKSIDFIQLAQDIKQWGQELGFQQVGITDTDLSQAETRLNAWLAKGYHGKMDYMAKHGSKRSRPAELVPNTLTILSVRMDYLPDDPCMHETLSDKNTAYVSRYALGRDYHKLIRKRLEQLAQKITQKVGPFGYRAFTDSAPVLERPLAEKADLGWQGKNTMLINRKAGSWFFLGCLYTDLPLPLDRPEQKNHCGKCSACIDICPTQAIVAPYQLDARRCISYLTIELRDSIPEELRPLMGNRIYGCDDCQLVCPWNRFAKITEETAFLSQYDLKNPKLTELFAWSESEFLQKTQGSAIRRIGHECWLRNIAVALGNAPYSPPIIKALQSRQDHPSALVREHVAWALQRQLKKQLNKPSICEKSD